MVRALQLIGGSGWAILPDVLAAMADIARRLGEGPDVLGAVRGQKLQDTRTVTVRDGVAIIPVVGPIFRRGNLFADLSGAGSTSTELLAREIRAAVEDVNVRAILLEIDSPGGEAAGIAELAGQIASYRKRKPIHAYADGACCSGAYWLAAACDTITAAGTAFVGSIGAVLTVCCHEDEEHVEFVSSQSPRKRVDLATAEGRSDVQRLVDDLAAVFVADVARYREVSQETVLNDFGQGGIMVGRRAVLAGLCDRLGTQEALIGRLAAGRALERAQRPAAASAEVEVLAAAEDAGGVLDGVVVQQREEQAMEDQVAGSAATETAAAPAATAAEVEELRRELARQRQVTAGIEAQNAALTAAAARRGIAERLAAVRILDGAAALAPRSREALTDALMSLAAEGQARMADVVAGVQFQPVAVLGFDAAEGEVGSGAAGVMLTAGEEQLCASEAQRKGQPVADVRAAFIAARAEQIEDGRYVSR